MPIDEVAARGFQAGAAAYEAARPGYPPEAISLLKSTLGINRRKRVCDLAAGTGKLTRELLGTGAEVVAVEPVTAMRRRLEDVLPEVDVVEGTAEDIPLLDRSVDAVTVGQAFHWFDADLALEEIARVLRRGGGLALIWNVRDERTPWVAEMSRLIHWHERTVSRYQHTDWAEVVARSGRFTPLGQEYVDWEQPLTRAQLADRVRSISYIAAMPEARREQMAADVVSLVSRMEEPIVLPYRCWVHWAKLRRR